MEIYHNLSGHSNVAAFEIGTDYITVQFKGTVRVYNYSYRKAGVINVENMKRLARSGSGLNSYINSNTKALYD